MPPKFQPVDLLRFGYDLKIVRSTDPIILNSSFVGASNESYLTINLLDIATNDFVTSGAEDLHMPIVVEDLGNDWYSIEMDFEVTTALLLKTNSIRWLFTPQANEFLYIDNVELLPLADEPFTNDALSAVSIDQENMTLNIEETTTLTYTTTPADATDALTWESSNEEVATVDANGVVTAVGKGAATITISSADEVITDSIVITVVANESGLSTGAIVAISVGGVAVLGGASYVFIFKKKKVV